MRVSCSRSNFERVFDIHFWQRIGNMLSAYFSWNHIQQIYFLFGIHKVFVINRFGYRPTNTKQEKIPLYQTQMRCTLNLPTTKLTRVRDSFYEKNAV